MPTPSGMVSIANESGINVPGKNGRKHCALTTRLAGFVVYEAGNVRFAFQLDGFNHRRRVGGSRSRGRERWTRRPFG
jgi:hypothetical protein